jgi:NADPH:quinone reductase-like Zn-dependent oxidoreductase
MYAIQLAKLHGAQVTGVDRGEKLHFMRAIGADQVIDYTREDFTRQPGAWDLILDIAGYRSPADYRRALAPGGRYLFTGGSVATLLRVLAASGTGRAQRKSLRVLAVRQGVHGLTPLVDLCRSGAVRTVIDRRFPLAEVPAALRYLGEGHAKGKVVIIVD